MTEHFLYRSQRRAAINQMARKAVAKGMWSYMFCYSCRLDPLPDEIEHSHT